MIGNLSFSLGKFKLFFLSHNNPCFQCNIAITNFLVWDKISWRHRSKHCTYVFLRKNSEIWLAYIAKWVSFGPLFFNIICLIQLCDKRNLTFVDCWDRIILNSSWKMLLSLKNVIKLAKGSPNNIFQDSFQYNFISTVNSWQILYITSTLSFLFFTCWYPITIMAAIISLVFLFYCKIIFSNWRNEITSSTRENHYISNLSIRY